jgi:hypothetical protein
LYNFIITYVPCQRITQGCVVACGLEWIEGA